MKRFKDRWPVHLHSLLVCLVCALTVACAPKPVVPSGAARVPVNNEEMISQYRERVTIEQREKQERSLLTGQVEALTKQVQELAASLTLVQLQQQEADTGRSRHGHKTNAATPLTHRSPMERMAPPTSAAPPRDVAAPPVVPTQTLSPIAMKLPAASCGVSEN